MYDIIFPFLPFILIFGFTSLFLLIITIIVEDFMAPKVEIATKRVPTITLTNGDVEIFCTILRQFLKASGKSFPDRRVIGWAGKILKQLDEQKIMIASLDEQDRQRALREFLDQYEEKDILELTDVIQPEELESDTLGPEGGLDSSLDTSRIDLGLNGGDDKPVIEDLDIDRDLDELGHDDRPPSLPNDGLDLEEIVRNGDQDEGEDHLQAKRIEDMTETEKLRMGRVITKAGRQPAT